MVKPIIVLCLALICTKVHAVEELTAGTQLSFRGTVAPLDRDRSVGKAEKTFDLMLILAEAAGAKPVYWILEERGRGAWPWTERFGQLSLDDLWRKGDQRGPALLYDLGEGKSAIEVTLPFLAADEPLALEHQWDEGAWKHIVQKPTRLDERDVWQVQVSNNYGPKRTVWVSKDSPLAVGIDERVFMGMGQEYLLQLRLVAAEPLAADVFSSTKKALDQLLTLRGGLNLDGRKETIDFNSAQRGLLAAQLPAIEKNAAGTPAERVARSAVRDLGQQSERSDAVGRLSSGQTGRATPQFSLEGLNQEKVSQADLAGKVTVLHFWDYRDSPLEEPYGQVGYLDFLSQRRKADGVKVYGVAVDGRLAEPAERSQALRGIRKLKAFMNLSYPVLLDTGSVIRQFGDPRSAGAELPLFVVIGKDGKIAHHHAGLYPVDRNEGLKELNAAVSRALEASK